MNSRWASLGPNDNRKLTNADDGLDVQWLKLDMGESPIFIDTIILEWEAAYSRNYDIMVSDDDILWEKVSEGNNGEEGMVQLKDLNARGRYIKIFSKEGSPNYGISLFEVEIYGDPDEACTTPIVPAGECDPELIWIEIAKASASSQESGDNMASKATDGNFHSTRWSSERANNQWFVVDLGRPMQISEVRLHWEHAHAREYILQKGDSLEGDWTDLVHITDSDGGIAVHDNLNNEVTQYLRLELILRATVWGFSLWEFEVKGAPVCTIAPGFDDANEALPGSGEALDNAFNDTLNTAEATETEAQKMQRLADMVPDDNIEQEYEPTDKAKCFNEAYTTDFTKIDQAQLYEDYEKIFEWGFRNEMGPPLQSVSEENNDVTNNRFPGMFLRMCFHDNSINPTMTKYQEYIDGYVDKTYPKKMRWNGPISYLETSGADASLLICRKERFHPNQNYDQTASRVLYSLQSDKVGIVKSGSPMSMVDKYNLSYADMLHNGCIAATIWLSPAKNPGVQDSLTKNPMKFGRKDACRYRWNHCDRKALCGPTELLPGVTFNAKQLNDWFVNRGMTECQWMSLMWTHTTLDNQGKVCPLRTLPCTDDQGKLDYFSFYLRPGVHETGDPKLVADDPEVSQCKWTPVDGGGEVEWPMTAADCSLGLDVVTDLATSDAGLRTLRDVITNFHDTILPVEDILMCALNMLSGHGTKNDCDNITGATCTEIAENGHMFGAYYDAEQSVTQETCVV
jgi:hypothetical protein